MLLFCFLLLFFLLLSQMSSGYIVLEVFILLYPLFIAALIYYTFYLLHRTDTPLQDQCMAQLERLVDNCRGVRERVVTQSALLDRLRTQLGDKSNENMQMRAASLLLALGSREHGETDTLQNLAKGASLPVGAAANIALQKVLCHEHSALFFCINALSH